MRLHDVEPVSDAAHAMLLKLRKGAAASLNAARLGEIFAVLPGWSLQKAKFDKPSGGGQVLKTCGVPGADRYYRGYNTTKDGLVHFEASEVTHKGNDMYENNEGSFGRKADQKKIVNFRDVIYPALKVIQGKKQKGWMVSDVALKEYQNGGHSFTEISFEFIVTCSGFLITSPDGQTYEVYGDYKNGALNPQTFEKFFAWAAENTDIVDSINEILGMEPHEKKIDPKAKYFPPKMASDAEKQIWKVLVELTMDIREKQKAALIAAIAKFIKRFEAAKINKDKEEILRMKDHGYTPALSYVWDFSKKELYSDWEARLDKFCDEQVEDMQNLYVGKNTRKLAAILTTKGGEFTSKPIHIDANGGVINSTIEFKCADESSFLVDNSVVTSYAPKSKRFFHRFPTIFRNVMLPDGTRMRGVSEETMNTVWAKAE